MTSLVGSRVHSSLIIKPENATFFPSAPLGVKVQTQDIYKICLPQTLNQELVMLRLEHTCLLPGGHSDKQKDLVLRLAMAEDLMVAPRV